MSVQLKVCLAVLASVAGSPSPKPLFASAQRRSTDARGKPVYHTNVMMAVGTGVAVVCAESVADARERQHLLASLSRWVGGGVSETMSETMSER
jgi:hypothetical protein